VKNRVENAVSGKTNRFMELEGLRGLAALVVFLFHFLVLFYPVMYYGAGVFAPIQHLRFEDNIHGTPLEGFLSGTFSVAVFFVLSGFVLSVGFFSTKNAEIVKKLAAKRYLRLMLPALASVLIALVFISLNLSSNKEAHEITQSVALRTVWSPHPGFFEALYEGSIGVFVHGPVNNYNSVLWTMQYEFSGSFIIFGLALLFGQSKWRWVVYLAAAIGFQGSWYLGFILGMVIADLYVHRLSLMQKIRQPFYMGILALGICLGAFPTSSKIGETIYGHVMLPWLSQAQNQSVYTTLGAVCIVLAALGLVGFKRFLSGRMMSQLGKYTYSLYLVHQPLIYTVGTGLFMLFISRFGYNKSVALAFVLTIPVVVAATLLFHKYIEQPSMRVAAYSEEVFSGKKELSLKREYKKITRRALAAIRRRVRPLENIQDPEVE